MVQQPISQQAYAQGSGTAPTNFPVIFQRDPTPFDIYYPIGQFWVNQATKSLWYLNSQSNVSGQLLSTWELISVASVLVSLSDNANLPVFPSLPTDTPPDNIQLVAGSGISIVATPASHLITITNTGAGAETLTGQDGVAVSPSGGGTIFTLGNVVTNNFHPGFPLYTFNSAANTEQWDIQVSKALALTDITKVGLAAFDSAFFTVDANGFVSANGGALVEKINLQTGTSPITPLAGAITFNGATVLAGTHPVRTDGTGAHTMTLEVQISQALAATDATKIGLSNFSNTQFAVDANGFVTLVGGGGAPTLGLTPDAHTPPGTSPVVPNGSGNIILEGGATFVTGTQANPIRTNSLAANTIDFQIQLAGSNAAASTANKFGVSQFDANQFTVTSGFVQIIGGGTTGAVTSLTGNDSVQVFPLTGNINVVGTGSITTVGTPNTETIELTGLTNHAVLVGAGTATITKIAATANTGAILQNNAGADPSYSTATYPSTTTINDILYSTANNVVGQLAAANSSVLASSATGVPTWLGPLTNGQIIIGSTGAIPVAATLTAGSGISITNAAGSITIAAIGGAGVVSTLTGNSGGAISPVLGNINTLGTGSITIVGAGNTLTTELTGLTNHAVQVGAGTATLTQVGPSASTGQILQNNAGADPSYSTATYPSTTTINQILYSSANNVVAGLSTANSAVLITSATGVPQLSSSLTNGELIIGSTGALPVTATLTAGAGINIVNGAGSITISATTGSVFNYKNVNHAASPYTVLVTDQYISCDTSGGTVILKFPDVPNADQYWIVKDRLGNASTNNISITTVTGTVTIDGATTYKITSNYGSVEILGNSTPTYEVF